MLPYTRDTDLNQLREMGNGRFMVYDQGIYHKNKVERILYEYREILLTSEELAEESLLIARLILEEGAVLLFADRDEFALYYQSNGNRCYLDSWQFASDMHGMNLNDLERIMYQCLILRYQYFQKYPPQLLPVWEPDTYPEHDTDILPDESCECESELEPEPEPCSRSIKFPDWVICFCEKTKGEESCQST